MISAPVWRAVRMCREDAGVATVLTMIAVCVVLVAMSCAAVLGHAIVGRARVSMVADLAALSVARTGSCEAALQVSSRHGVELVDCTWDGFDALVTVRDQPAGTVPGLPSFVNMKAKSRAGY